MTKEDFKNIYSDTDVNGVRYFTMDKIVKDFIQTKKRIAELEAENAELKKEVEKHKWNNIFLEDCADYDKKIAEEYTTLQERIAELEEEVTRLRNENLDIINKYTGFAETDRRTIAELEAQIEKMKRCENCKHCVSDVLTEHCKSCYRFYSDILGTERKADKWEIREK